MQGLKEFLRLISPIGLFLIVLLGLFYVNVGIYERDISQKYLHTPTPELRTTRVPLGDADTIVAVYFCGNNVQEYVEECDGVDLNGESCVSRGFSGGTLSCDSNCEFDETNCDAPVATSTPTPSPTITEQPGQTQTPGATVTPVVSITFLPTAAPTKVPGFTPTPIVTLPPEGPFTDTDGDGIPDYYELAFSCLNHLVRDADQDPDGDGLDNMREFELLTNPCNSDTDGDGLPDGWEVEHGTKVLINDGGEDPDNDGRNNLQEYIDGTDPLSRDVGLTTIPDTGDATPREFAVYFLCLCVIGLIPFTLLLYVLIMRKQKRDRQEKIASG